MRLLISLWPAAIPVILFLLWYAWKYACAKKQPDGIVPALKQSPWLLTLASSIIIAVVCLFAVVLSEGEVKGKYVPATLEGGTLKGGSITQP